MLWVNSQHLETNSGSILEFSWKKCPFSQFSSIFIDFVYSTSLQTVTYRNNAQNATKMAGDQVHAISELLSWNGGRHGSETSFSRFRKCLFRNSIPRMRICPAATRNGHRSAGSPRAVAQLSSSTLRKHTGVLSLHFRSEIQHFVQFSKFQHIWTVHS